MFERFTDRARRVVVLSQEEARALGHNYIGTEHLLLGVLRESEGVGAQALAAQDIVLGDVRDRIVAIVGAPGEEELTGHIPFTPRCKKVLELSFREALQLGHNYIGTEHILLGILREGEGLAAQVLVELGVDLDSLSSQVIELAQSAGEGFDPEAFPRERIRPGELLSRGPLAARLQSIDERLGRIESLLRRLVEGSGPGSSEPDKEPGA